MSRISLFCVVCVLSGCQPAGTGQVTADNAQQLALGLSEADAVALLGPPGQVADADGVRTLTWQRGDLSVTAVFKQDKLTERKAMLDGLPLAFAEPAAPRPRPDDEDASAAEPAKPPRKSGPRPGQKFATIFDRSRAVANGKVVMVAQDSFSGRGDPDTPTDGSVLAGFIVHLDDHLHKGRYVCALQPIWLTPAGLKRGKVLGPRGKVQTEISAKPGYAVSDVNSIAGKGIIYQVSVTYARIDGDLLDETDQYESKAIGPRGPDLETNERCCTSTDKPIIGVECHFSPVVNNPNAPKRLDGIKIWLGKAADERE